LNEVNRGHELANLGYELLRGRIVGVFCKDTRPGRQTLVSVFLYDGYPALYDVPVLTPYSSAQDGEAWTPKEGDEVVVGFIAGRVSDPYVVGFVSQPNNPIEKASSEKVLYRRRMGGGYEQIDTSGNRITVIEGSEDLTVNTGDVTINVLAGKATVTVAGKTVWTSAGIDLVGGAGDVKGVIQGDCLCVYTLQPHGHVSATVKATK
jgi:hypothetical protein